jgi:hypothetical protein
MKHKLAILAVLPFALSAQVLLTDDFNDASIDSGKWSVILPYGGSSVTANGSVLTTTGRGILASVASFSAPYTITGTFIMHHEWEHFNIVLRSDLSAPATGSYNERTGIIVTFVNDGDGISIQQYPTGSDWAQLASTGGNGYALITGQPYSFSITDTGTRVNVAVNGVDVVSANSTFSTGNHIGFYSREFGSTATSIDFITVTDLTDPNLTIETALSLKFDTALGRHYTIQVSTDLENWTDIETDIIGNGTRMQRFYEIVSPRQFYRIKP